MMFVFNWIVNQNVYALQLEMTLLSNNVSPFLFGNGVCSKSQFVTPLVRIQSVYTQEDIAHLICHLPDILYNNTEEFSSF